MRTSLLATILCGLLQVAAAVESRGTVRLAEEVLGQAEHAKFDYQGHIIAATAGDETAVRELFLFTRHTDAARALGHGVALVDLLQTIGEEMPARVAKNLSSDDKRRLKQMMEAGVDYGLHVAPAEWAARFPRMAAAFSPVRISLASLSVVSVLIFVGLLAIRRRLQLRHVDV